MTEDTQCKNFLADLEKESAANKPGPKDGLGLLSPHLSEGLDQPPFFGLPCDLSPKNISSADCESLRLEIARLTSELSTTRALLSVKCPFLSIINDHWVGIAAGVSASGWAVAIFTMLRYALLK